MIDAIEIIDRAREARQSGDPDRIAEACLDLLICELQLRALDRLAELRAWEAAEFFEGDA